MDHRGLPMYQDPRMTMMGQSDVTSVPGSIPINYHMGHHNPGSMGMNGQQMSDNHISFTGAPMSDNHASFTHKSDLNKMQTHVPQQHYSQLPVRKEVDDEGRICGVVLPKPPDHHPSEENVGTHLHIKENDAAHLPIKENDEGQTEISQENIKTEEEEDISNFMESAHDVFLQISSKELRIKEASEILGRPYSFVYSRYQEFCDNITGTTKDNGATTKKKGAKTKKKGKKKRKPKKITSKSKKNGKIYQCDDCPAIFHSEWGIQNHSKLHKPGNKKSHLCTACGILFPRLGPLMVHRLEIHGDALQCPHCDKQYTVITSYKFHVKSHNKKRPFVCDECGKGFFSRFNLEGHYRQHTGERPYMCGYCEKTFTTLNILKAHQYVHTGRENQHKPYECQECDKRYKSADELDQHMNTHTGAKPYACDQCDSRFNFKANLTRHRMMHTGVKPFKCNYCPAEFFLKTDLARHDMAHTGNKPFKCTLCDYSCVRKPILDYHMNTHTGDRPFKCDFYGCSAEFSRPSTLKQHKLKHGPPVFKSCKVCNEQFPDMNSLKRHMMIHPGNKPVTCDQCFKVFYNESTLKRHMHTHMYKPDANKPKQVRPRKKNPPVKRPTKPETPPNQALPLPIPLPKKMYSEYQVPAVAENGHNSLAHTWTINAEDTNSQQSFHHSFPPSQFTNLVNNAWPSTIDPDELRNRLLASFK